MFLVGVVAALLRIYKVETRRNIMGATSATGVGIGDSGGLQKPENHITCGGAKPDEEEIEAPLKRGCVIRSVSGGIVRSKSGGFSRIRVC